MRISWLRNLFFGNAMLEETTRVWRGLRRGGHANTSRSLTNVLFGMIFFFYFWFCYEMAKWGIDTNSSRDAILLCEYLELVAITLILPASVYGAIAGERERGTWEALILTRLTAGQIIFGKLFWRILVIVILMLLLFLPECLAIGFHGVYSSGGTYHFRNYVLAGQLLNLSWGALLTSFGLWVSAGSRRSVTAASSVFVSLLAALILLPLLYGLLAASQGGAAKNGDGFAMSAYGWNPFYLLGTSEYNPSNSTPNFNALPGVMVITMYFALSILFLSGTLARLRRLEEPKRRTG